MKLINQPREIICVLPKGRAMELVRLLHEEKNIEAVNFHSGRGRSTAVTDSISYGQYAEVEVVSVIVEAQQAEDIFDFIFFEADINKPHGGFLYQVPLSLSNAFHLPELPNEDESP